MIFYKVLGVYALFALLVAITYTYLYHKHFMPAKVKKAGIKEIIRAYGMLFLGTFAGAPYALYEIIKTYKNGGFKK